MTQRKYQQKKMSIKSWAEDDRPREKMLDKGRQALSDAELIAIIIGSGNWSESAVELSKRILQQNGNNIARLARMSVQELMRFRGIGEAKAIAITAALELGRRRMEADIFNKRESINGSIDVFNMMRAHYIDMPHEEFWIILLNRANVIMHKEMISRGGTSATVVDAKLVFRTAMNHGASGIIMVHNHPSGNLKPSESDIQLTRRLQQGAGLLELELVDHVIVTSDNYFSFSDEGQL